MRKKLRAFVIAWLAGTAAIGAQAQPDDGQWTMPAKDYASTRFSDLAQITAQNVGQLKPAFTFDTGFLKGHEAAPLIVGSTMYLATLNASSSLRSVCS